MFTGVIPAMRLLARFSGVSAVALLAACATQTPPPPPPPPTVQVPASAGVYKVGQPYQIDNIWYYPREQPDYDETGIASWYGPTFYGKKTANGEIYTGDMLTAAHKTLPMPVNVRVTNLDNGKSLIVRVNDRGPFSRGRIIDLSRRAAELLDIIQSGTARVRVTYMGRSELNGAPAGPEALAGGPSAAPSGKVDSAALGILPGATVAPPAQVAGMPKPAPIPAEMFNDAKPDGKVTQVSVPPATRLYVQVGAFTRRENAQALLNKLGGGMQISPLQRGGQTLYRVRSAPFASVKDADAALSRVTGAGANDAHIVVDQ